MLQKRRKLLLFLKRTDLKLYLDILNDMGIRPVAGNRMAKH